jgi:DNA-binding HxlR family transcriptional regulator
MSENSQSMVDNPTDDSRCICPLGGVMDLLSRKYAMQVICVVGMLQPVRYSDIDAAFGEVSSSTLSTRLHELSDAEVLAREQYDEIPPRVEYDLTAEGEELCELLLSLLQWDEERKSEQ